MCCRIYIYGHLRLGLSRPPGGDYNPIVFAMQFGLIRVVRPCQALRLQTNRRLIVVVDETGMAGGRGWAGPQLGPEWLAGKAPFPFLAYQASPIIFFMSGTDMTFDEGLLGIGGGTDFSFDAVWFLLLALPCAFFLAASRFIVPCQSCVSAGCC